MGILIYMDTDLCTHVALVGLMGAGKTVIGASLARKSNVRHVDLDRWIQNRYGRSIGVIFNERGEKGFREIETDALKEVLGSEEPVAVSYTHLTLPTILRV